MPIHPRTQKVINKFKWKPKKFSYNKACRLKTSVELILNCNLVFTDSGGLKRGVFCKKTVYLAQSKPLWPQAVKSAGIKLSIQKIFNKMKKYLDYFPKPKKHSLASFGDGKSCKINKFIDLYFK